MNWTIRTCLFVGVYASGSRFGSRLVFPLLAGRGLPSQRHSQSTLSCASLWGLSRIYGCRLHTCRNSFGFSPFCCEHRLRSSQISLTSPTTSNDACNPHHWKLRGQHRNWKRQGAFSLSEGLKPFRTQVGIQLTIKCRRGGMGAQSETHFGEKEWRL